MVNLHGYLCGKNVILFKLVSAWVNMTFEVTIYLKWQKIKPSGKPENLYAYLVSFFNRSSLNSEKKIDRSYPLSFIDDIEH